MEDEDLNILARLSIRSSYYLALRIIKCLLCIPNIDPCVVNFRCLPGYPHKCPKIQILSQKGLSKKDADQLLSLLLDQVGGLKSNLLTDFILLYIFLQTLVGNNITCALSNILQI